MCALLLPTVVLVDDDRTPLELLRRSFAPEVRVLAESAQAALALLEQGEIDVLLLDPRTSGLDGLALLTDAQTRSATVATILLGEPPTGEDLTRALAHGHIYHVLDKPLGATELVMTVRHGLERAALRRELARRSPEALDHERDLVRLIESMADGVVMAIDRNEQFFCNTAARRMLGIEPGIAVTARYLKEKLGFYPFDLIRTQAPEETAAALLREQIRIGDKILHSVVSALRAEQGKPMGVVLVLRDITDARMAEHRNEDLVSIVSHELRTPLTSIAGALDIVLNNYPQSVGDKPRRYVTLAREGCTRLHALIDDLLDAAKLESGQLSLRPAPVMFDAVAANAIEKFRPAAEQKRIALRLWVERAGMRALIDADRMTQVLSNLLSNALKFTPEDGEISVEVFGTTGATTHLGFCIWNNGPAIPAEAHERIFEKFETADPAPDRRVGGTGLGLSISRSIVEGHGGRIWIEPVRHGASFVLTIPTSPPDKQSAERSANDKEAARTALVITDGRHLGLLLKGMLSAAGWRVERAETADDGLTLARVKRPSVIVLDLGLAADVAMAVIEILKHDPETKDIPVLALATTDRTEMARAREADGMLVLPLDGQTFTAYCDKLALRGAHSPARLLVVDDDPSIRAICREVLEQAGYQVDEAPDGQAALESVARQAPDLMVLDVMMPRQDGFQVVRHLKAGPTPRLPIILLSARGQTADKVQAFKEGAEDYLVKPFDNQELVMRVEKALERRAREASASPSTRLPGSAAIEAEIERRLAQGGDFAFCYIDLDNLKAFNDYYGYAKADGVIRQTGDILRDVILREGGAGDFVGHIAGDDFVLMTTRDRADRICQRLIETFDRLIPLYYDRADRERGYIETNDRYGQMRRFSLLSLSVAALTHATYGFRDAAELARLAAGAKRKAKEVPTSSYVRDGLVIIPHPQEKPPLTPTVAAEN